MCHECVLKFVANMRYYITAEPERDWKANGWRQRGKAMDTIPQMAKTEEMAREDFGRAPVEKTFEMGFELFVVVHDLALTWH